MNNKKEVLVMKYRGFILASLQLKSENPKAVWRKIVKAFMYGNYQANPESLLQCAENVYKSTK